MPSLLHIQLLLAASALVVTDAVIEELLTTDPFDALEPIHTHPAAAPASDRYRPLRTHAHSVRHAIASKIWEVAHGGPAPTHAPTREDFDAHYLAQGDLHVRANDADNDDDEDVDVSLEGLRVRFDGDEHDNSKDEDDEEFIREHYSHLTARDALEERPKPIRSRPGYDEPIDDEDFISRYYSHLVVRAVADEKEEIDRSLEGYEKPNEGDDDFVREHHSHLTARAVPEVAEEVVDSHEHHDKPNDGDEDFIREHYSHLISRDATEERENIEDSREHHDKPNDGDDDFIRQHYSHLISRDASDAHENIDYSLSGYDERMSDEDFIRIHYGDLAARDIIQDHDDVDYSRDGYGTPITGDDEAFIRTHYSHLIERSAPNDKDPEGAFSDYDEFIRTHYDTADYHHQGEAQQHSHAAASLHARAIKSPNPILAAIPESLHYTHSLHTTTTTRAAATPADPSPSPIDWKASAWSAHLSHLSIARSGHHSESHESVHPSDAVLRRAVATASAAAGERSKTGLAQKWSSFTRSLLHKTTHPSSAVKAATTTKTTAKGEQHTPYADRPACTASSSHDDGKVESRTHFGRSVPNAAAGGHDVAQPAAERETGRGEAFLRGEEERRARADAEGRNFARGDDVAEMRGGERKGGEKEEGGAREGGFVHRHATKVAARSEGSAARGRVGGRKGWKVLPW